jgi:hypothetical protein
MFVSDRASSSVFWCVLLSVPVTPEDLSPISPYSISPIYPTYPYHCSYISHNRFLYATLTAPTQPAPTSSPSLPQGPHPRCSHAPLQELHVNWADKHEATPVMVIRKKGMKRTAEVLGEWVVNKDMDPRQREPGGEEGKESGR